MTELTQEPSTEDHEQLMLDIEGGLSPEGVAAIGEIIRSETYLRLAAERDAAYDRHRSGSRAIARSAFAALREGEITDEEFALLFPVRGEDGARTPVAETPFETWPSERPSRELDWAERAAGEGVDRRQDSD